MAEAVTMDTNGNGFRVRTRALGTTAEFLQFETYTGDGMWAPLSIQTICKDLVVNYGTEGTVYAELCKLNLDGSVREVIGREEFHFRSSWSAGLWYDESTDTWDIIGGADGYIRAFTPPSEQTEYYGFRVWGYDESGPEFPGMAVTEIVRSPYTELGDWGNPVGAYIKDDGQYANTAAKGAAHTYDGYDFFMEVPGETPIKVEVGIEGYGDGNDYVELEASWDGGTSWTAPVSYTPPTSEPSEPVYVDVTSGRSWTWDELSYINFRVRITKRSVGKGKPIYVDWMPVKVTSR